MKSLLLSITVLFFVTTGVFSNGVGIIDATEGAYLKLKSSSVEVMIYNQVASLTTTQVFYNHYNVEKNIKYAFPLYEDASPTSLRWYVNGEWYTAVFSPTPQDTTLPGGGDPDPDLMEFLGETPLFFNVPDTILADSTIIFELTYVQLLPYDFNEVGFHYPNAYNLIQDDILDFQKLHLTLESERIIEQIELTSHSNAMITNTGYFAEVIYEEFETPAEVDYSLEYVLNADQLGLFNFSTFLSDTANDCDTLGNGFLAMIVEPDPGDSLSVIPKTFTFIIDRSGSMSGQKIVEARNAAEFIVNNLNEGDYFNIVDFSSGVNSFAEDHVPFTPANLESAVAYIQSLTANGSTNISGAFSNAIIDFSGNDTTQANIVIFFTDGLPTAGITSTSGILDHIQQQINYWEVNDLTIHTFGIGEDVNIQLLTLIASQNIGISQFLLDSELEEEITNFYLRIQNPVLLNTEMTFEPPIIFETYPNPLSNLYLGQQLIVVGRYEEADSINAVFEGEKFGQPVTYSYGFSLSDSLVEGHYFLVKIWAKKKIEDLYIEYFNHDPNSPQAEALKEEIVDISLCYNVLSPFTSFSGGGITGIEFDENEFAADASITSYNYPNPFDQHTAIYFRVDVAWQGKAEVFIYDLFGRVIASLYVDVYGPGNYVVVWDGKSASGMEMPIGHYFYHVKYGSQVHKGRMVKN